MDSEEMDRVRRNTPAEINHMIDCRIDSNLHHYANLNHEEISRRIDELDREWDMERILETNAASFTLLRLALAKTKHRKWLLLSTDVAGFLLQHALQGWCPPVSVFRRLGVRTRGEIDREKYGLKHLRGDFKNQP